MKVLAQVGYFLRLDDYRAGYRGIKKGRSVYLFTGLPRRVLLGNLAYLTREGWSAASKARREEGRITSTMLNSATISSTALRTRIPTVGPRTTPGAPARRLSTQITMVAR